MIISRKFQTLFLVIFFSTITFAQPETDQDTKQSAFKIQLAQTLNETAELKLAENRAFVYARVGKLYWKFDENRARQIFQKSINELVKAQNEAEPDKNNSQRRTDLLVFGKTRQKILDIIVSLNADLAFKFLIESRSSTVKDAFAGISNEPAINTYNGMSSDKLIVQQEKMLQSRLYELVADQNPDRAVVILSDILRKNYSYNTIRLLEKIYQKDEKTAGILFKEIIQKTLSADFNQNSEEFQLANYLLFESAQESFVGKSLTHDIETLHKLAEKVADFLIQTADRNAEYTVTDVTPILLKILPERAEELKQKTVPRRRSAFEFFPQYKQAIELLQSNATAEELLDEADKYPPGFKEQIYVAAVNKIALTGDVKRAKEILIKNFPVGRQAEMIAALNLQLAYRAIKKGEIDAASEFIEKSPENTRVELFINLAENILLKSSDGTPKALFILEKTRKLISDTPINLNEINRMGQLAVAYSKIEPETGFTLLNSVIKKLVQVNEADFIVKDFRGDYNFHKGELIIDSSSLFIGYAELQNSLTKLSQTDFDKTLEIINKIPRTEMRITFKLQILENTLIQ